MKQGAVQGCQGFCGKNTTAFTNEKCNRAKADGDFFCKIHFNLESPLRCHLLAP